MGSPFPERAFPGPVIYVNPIIRLLLTFCWNISSAGALEGLSWQERTCVAVIAAFSSCSACDQRPLFPSSNFCFITHIIAVV